MSWSFAYAGELRAVARKLDEASAHDPADLAGMELAKTAAKRIVESFASNTFYNGAKVEAAGHGREVTRLVVYGEHLVL